jgi:hypothetical protein
VLESASNAGARRAVIESMAAWYAPAGTQPMGEDAPLYLDAPEPIGTAVRALAAMEKHASIQGST